MKTTCFFALFLMPVLCHSQTDTAAIIREVDSLIKVSRSMIGRWQLDKAVEINIITEELVRNKLGKESASYGNLCNVKGLVSFYKNDWAEAEKLWTEARSVRGKILGTGHPDYAGSLINLGILYAELCEYEKAELFYLEGKEIFEKKLKDRNHKFYGNCLTNLGSLYWKMGLYGKAEALYLEVKSITEARLGTQNPSYALDLYNLGLVYKTLYNYEKAEHFILESLSIREQLLGKEHPDYALSLALLGSLYYEMGLYEKAVLIIEEVVSLNEKKLGKTDPQFAGSLINLGLCYHDIGNYEKAESLFLEAKDVFENRINNTRHYYYINCLSDLGKVNVNLKRYEKAESFYLNANDIRSGMLGKAHPNYKDGLLDLANLYWLTNRYDDSGLLLSEANKMDKQLMLKSVRHLSEQELTAYRRKFDQGQSRFFSFAQAHRNMPGDCYENAVFFKGFLLVSTQQMNNLVLLSPTTADLFNLLRSHHRRLASQYSKPIAQRDSALIASLEEKANALEKELTRTVAGFGDALRQVSWQEIRDRLKPGEAAVEFVHYGFYNPMPTDSIMYAALVLLPGDTMPHFVPLFERRQILPLIRGASGAGFRKINECYSATANGRKLYGLVWEPLEALLQGAKTIYASPSGLLHRLNLGALPAGTRQTFGESRSVVTLGSTRQLASAEAAGKNNAVATAAVFGGIRYETDTAAMFSPGISYTAATRGMADVLPFYPDSSVRGGSWNYLPGSRSEALDIAAQLRKARYEVQLDTGYLATEEAFLALGREKTSPRILHIATHGFFFPDPKEAAGNGPSLSDRDNTVFRLSDNPMMRSGLILAGANQAWRTGTGPKNREDGVLTAYEISHTDLSGTELAVLSACETGLGEIESNEGVYGLQRAFKIAGVKYLIMSLWKVNDAGTREFMAEFYRYWLEKQMTIPEAFRKAQAHMKAKYPDSPYHWAGFVLVE